MLPRRIAITLAMALALAVGAPGAALAQAPRRAAVSPPIPLDSPAPIAPKDRPDAVGKNVAFIVTISPQGRIERAHLESGLGPRLDAIAERAVRGWRFEPAKRGHTAVRSRVRVVVTFIRERPPEPTHDPESAAADPLASRAEAHPESELPTDVMVHGHRRPEPQAASDFDIDVSRVRDVPRRDAEQLLTLAPGVVLTNHSGRGHASQIFMRGFDAAEGQDIEFRLEGVPLNEVSNPHGHGYADTHFIIPELVERMRVIQGPFDAQQGDFAVAGSAYYHLGHETRGITTKATYGSFATRRLLLLWGPNGASRHTFVGVDFNGSDGFGPNRASSSSRFMGQYDFKLGARTHLKLLATGYLARWDAAGVVRFDDAVRNRLPCPADRDSQFFCAVDPNQGGNSTRHGIAARITHRAKTSRYENVVFSTLRELGIRENLTGFSLDTPPPGASQRGDGIAQHYNVVTVGSRGSYAFDLETPGRRDNVEVGYVVRYDDGRSAQERVRFSDAAPYRTDFDNLIRVTNVGAYAKARVSPVRRWTLRAGVHIDAFGYGVTDRNRPTRDREGARLGQEQLSAHGVAVQPKLTSELEVAKPVSWLTSFGIGTRSSGAQGLSAGEFAPFARAIGVEAGPIAHHRFPGVHVDGRLIGYATRVDRDLLFDPEQGRNVFVGASNRFGATAAASLSADAGIETMASTSYSEAYLPPDDASALDLTAGTRMPFVPRWVTRVDTMLTRPVAVAGRRGAIRGAVGLSHVAGRPVPFGQTAAPMLTIDGAIKARYKNVELGFDIYNLLDRRNMLAVYNYPSNFTGPTAPISRLPARHFAAGAPRTILFSVAVTFGGEEDAR